jgi:tetratricopeptide (TPR) repeat protein
MRSLLSAGFAITLFAQSSQNSPKDSQKNKPEAVTQEPPEEDASSIPKEYVLNPLQAEKEYRVGLYYLKKGTVKAAVHRFEEATKWNPAYADAYEKLGDAYSRLRDEKAAHEAYKKFLELQPDGKEAAAVRKKLGKS